MTMTRSVRVLILAGLSVACGPAGDTDAGGLDGGAPDAGAPDAGVEPPPCGTDRVREDLAIPTLDGQTLFGILDRPAQADCPLPTVLLQTPYGAESGYDAFFGAERSTRPLFASPHYNYVIVDWRGRFGSGGLPHAGEGPWLAQDSYDTVEWIAEQPWSDGEVGLWGVSALCGAQYRTAVGPRSTATNPGFDDEPPPHLGAIVPIMCPLRETFDAVYPGGVIRHERAQMLDVLGFGLRSIYESNPRRNLLWNIAETANDVSRIRVPALVVGGFHDIQPTQTVDAYRELVQGSDPSVRDEHRLLLGPWIHFAVGGEIQSGAARMLTADERAFLDLERRIDRDALAWFDHHLRGVDNEVTTWEPVRYHVAGDGWRGASEWPPASSTRSTFYLHPDGTMADAMPPSAGSITFSHDPADPTPTIGGATLAPYDCLASATPLACLLSGDPSNLLLHGPTSQAPLLSRADQVMFATEPLSDPLSIVGEVHVLLDVATTGDDGDVAVRLVDLDAADDPLLVAEGIARLSARGSDDTTWSPVSPGARYSIEITMISDVARVIAAGHRLGLIVSAYNFPLFGRNPNDGAVFYQGDTASGTPASLSGAGRAAQHTLYLDGVARVEVQTPM